ncbi:hypothetical protein [Subtercola boreus]|uniref:hypothetical protein n=1 Tax=Subtercola boreus TaxID=120213 RepID=UPI00116D9893|nr:hypothetical protein [Subtercola boreus]TQL53976.1 hypothetical protein FB464_1502 [Subtercola boreus]
MSESKRPSVLAGLIAEGKADPITAEERAIVAEIRAYYEKKFGRRADGGSADRGIPKSA